MKLPEEIVFHAAPHPNPMARRFGFPLGHPYVEQCWSPLIGPSCTLILRRVHLLWQEESPAVQGSHEFAQSLGVGMKLLKDNLVRLTHYGFGSSSVDLGSFHMYSLTPALTPRQQEKVPPWTQAAHARLLDAHLESLPAEASPERAAAPSINQRLEHLQRPTTNAHPGLHP